MVRSRPHEDVADILLITENYASDHGIVHEVRKSVVVHTLPIILSFLIMASMNLVELYDSPDPSGL